MKVPLECIACGARLDPGRWQHGGLAARCCPSCWADAEEAAILPHIFPDAPIPGAPWTAEKVSRSLRCRTLNHESGVFEVWPDGGPVTEVSVTCAAPGAFHERHGESRRLTVVRWHDIQRNSPPRWWEDVTPSDAEVARRLNRRAPRKTMNQTDDIGSAAGGLAMAIRMASGQWAVHAVRRPGRVAADFDRRVRKGEPQACIRFQWEQWDEAGPLQPTGEPWYRVAHMNVRCGCGLEYRRREATYSQAFDKLAAAGKDRIELRDLLRFA